MDSLRHLEELIYQPERARQREDVVLQAGEVSLELTLQVEMSVYLLEGTYPFSVAEVNVVFQQRLEIDTSFVISLFRFDFFQQSLEVCEGFSWVSRIASLLSNRGSFQSDVGHEHLVLEVEHLQLVEFVAHLRTFDSIFGRR